MKLKIVVAFVLIASLLVCAFMSIDRIIIFTLSKIYGINVSYTSLLKDRASGYSFENLKVLNRRAGIGFFASRAELKLNKTTSLFKSLDIDFRFRDVHFVTTKPESAVSAYDSLNKIVAVPFEGRWKYRDISGTVEIFSNGLTLKNTAANGNEIRMSVSGEIFYNSAIDLEITIFFSKGVLNVIPADLQSVVMKDEPKDWKSFSVKIAGDYQSPSLSITGKLFRLNIGNFVAKE